MHFVNRIKRYWNLFSTTNVLKTIYFNFKMFPFNVAIKHPIHLAYGVEIIGAKRGVIVLDKIKSGGKNRLSKIPYASWERDGDSYTYWLRKCKALSWW